MPEGEAVQKIDIEKILLETNYVSEEDLKSSAAEAKKSKGNVLDVLFARGFVTADLLGQATGEFYKLEYIDLNSHPVPQENVQKITEEDAKKYRIVFVGESKDGVVKIASDRPENAKSKDVDAVLKKIFPKKKFSIGYTLPEDIDRSFLHYRKPLETRFAKILEDDGGFAPEVIQQIFEDAVSYKASDIHFEPLQAEVVIRFRVDGILREAGRVPRDRYENILNRLKVQSQLRIDQHFAAQDGAIRTDVGGNPVDLRISIVPTLDGEKVVLRLLAQYVKGFAASDLGLSPAHSALVIAASKKPFGMILVAGPTGSGKTTTLYVFLKSLHKPEINITTIEDPVEYRIPGINQIQVNEATGLTFADGLRSIVRQDPNVILVGEIRDHITAEIAVNAALTGHLLLSTFHANDAATAIPRLLDMGVEPFLLSSTLELIIAQRLVRRICESCRYSEKVTKKDLDALAPAVRKFFVDTTSFYRGKGCPACNESGYVGRTGIFEVIPFNKEMRDLVLRHPSSSSIWELARKNGSHSLFEDGVEKVNTGVTTIEELLRVAAPPELEKAEDSEGKVEDKAKEKSRGKSKSEV